MNRSWSIDLLLEIYFSSRFQQWDLLEILGISMSKWENSIVVILPLTVDNCADLSIVMLIVMVTWSLRDRATEENNDLRVLTMLSPMGQYLYTMSTMVRGIEVVAIRRSVRARLAISTFRVVSRTLAEYSLT